MQKNKIKKKLREVLGQESKKNLEIIEGVLDEGARDTPPIDRRNKCCHSRCLSRRSLNLLCFILITVINRLSLYYQYICKLRMYGFNETYHAHSPPVDANKRAQELLVRITNIALIVLCEVNLEFHDEASIHSHN